MPKASVFRFGFVGAGRIARVHAEALRELGGAEIVAWSAGHWHNAEKASGSFGGRPMTTEDLLKHPEIDAVLISSPTPRHHEQTLAALAQGKHVFCEKPMTRTDEEAQAVLTAAKSSECGFYVGHTLRFFSRYAKARELLRAGAIGTLRRVASRRLNAPPAEGRASWFFDFAQSGGCILDLMIHDFDFLQWCLGKPTRIEAETAPNKDPEGWQHAIVHLYFKGGARAEVEGSWLHHRHERSLLLEGDNGKITIDPDDGLLRLENSQGARVIEVPVVDGYREQMHHFLEHLRSGAPLLVTPQDAASALAIALTALQKLGKE